MIHRKLKREYARVIRGLSDEVLRYVIEEGGHELKRRRLQVRERRAKKRASLSSPADSPV